jgi:hypothetical protein
LFWPPVERVRVQSPRTLTVIEAKHLAMGCVEVSVETNSRSKEPGKVKEERKEMGKGMVRAMGMR